MTAMGEDILIDRLGPVATVTLNRPRVRNALGSAGTAALHEALAALAADPDCRAVVLAGAPPAFCSGSDLKELGGLSVPEMCRHEAEMARLVRGIGMLPLPVVAAVEGYALGGGMILALGCDVVVTARSARWHLPEVPNGWLPPWGLQALMARVGPVRARLLTWGVAPVDGAEALRLGLADLLAEDGQALAEAQAFAARLAALPPGAVRSTKRYFEPFIQADAERQDAEAARVFAADAQSAASQATLARFAVKR
jgi:enoyl-CoA hydratase/carnithine racemase